MSRRSAVEVVTIGDELLLGFTIDTNAAHVARALASIGMHVARRSTVGDDPDQIARAVSEALDRTGAVVTTGGLGPTADDMTKASIAKLFGREMRLDEAHLQWMKDRWQKRFQRPMPEANRLQAMIPDGARKLENRHGSAPGIWIEDDRGRWVAMLPGVPREMRGMLDDTLIPLLRERMGNAGTVVRSRTIRTTGVAESLIADKLPSLSSDLSAVSLAYLPGIEGVDLRLTVRDLPDVEADALLGRAVAYVHERVGDSIYAEDSGDLAAVVLDACRARQLHIAVAESCTGGLLGARLTAISGSSDVVIGGVIAYADAIKRDVLGVNADVLREHGAVSEPVVKAMAAGVRARCNAEVGLAITGVAGPTGGTPDKPVGTVWICCDVQGRAESRLLRLWGDRTEVRARSAQAVMELLRRMLGPTTH